MRKRTGDGIREMRNIYIFTGKNKDPDGSCRMEAERVIRQSGGGTVGSPDKAEAILSLGGDGTMMRAAHYAVLHNIPLIGVNLGRIGYLTELDRKDIALISRLISEDFEYDERMALDVSCSGGESFFAFNDAVIRAASTHMVSVSVECDGSAVNAYRGDGLIFSTPTGSTAYSMSAGGSVIDPGLKCICLTPICPQALTARPLVFSPERRLDAEVSGSDCILTVDGGTGVRLKDGSVVSVSRSERTVKLIKLRNEEFFGVLRKKLAY